MRPHTWSRAKPLLHVAGNTIIGHLLNLMSDVTEAPGNELILWSATKATRLRPGCVPIIRS
ncbi:MAG: hypothetical protein R3E31_15425 [Chloroflexota bacterium]